MASQRPQKIYRLNYWKADLEYAANLTVYGGPAEVRMSASPKSFISVKQDGITFSPGTGNSINIQAMSQNFRFGGMLSDLPFPLSMIPSTVATPTPKQVIVPPLLRVLPQIREFAALASSFL